MNVFGQNIRTVYNQLQEVAETLKSIEPKEDNYLKPHKRKILEKKDHVSTSKIFHGNYIFFNVYSCTNIFYSISTTYRCNNSLSKYEMK